MGQPREYSCQISRGQWNLIYKNSSVLLFMPLLHFSKVVFYDYPCEQTSTKYGIFIPNFKSKDLMPKNGSILSLMHL